MRNFETQSYFFLIISILLIWVWIFFFNKKNRRYTCLFSRSKYKRTKQKAFVFLRDQLMHSFIYVKGFVLGKPQLQVVGWNWRTCQEERYNLTRKFVLYLFNGLAGLEFPHRYSTRSLALSLAMAAFWSSEQLCG